MSPPPLAAPSRPSRSWAKLALRGLAGLFLFGWTLVLATWLTLHWWILPRLDEWRPAIETRVGDALGVPLRIGSIKVRSGSWVPAFDIDDVSLLDPDGRVALQLGHVSAALSPSSLWTFQLRFAQLHFDGVQLDARRDAQGRIFVAGVGMTGEASSDRGAIDWLFEQPELVIRRGSLRWTDEQRDAPPLQLSDVDLVLRNDFLHHAIRLDATPPAAWGERFALRGRFTQPLTAPSGNWRRWRGELFAGLPLADLSQLGHHVALPFALSEGRGALRAWIDVDQGQVVQGTADLALGAVSLRLGEDLPVLELQRLQGRVLAARDSDGLEVRLDRLSFVSGDGVPWAPSTARLTLQQTGEGPVTGGMLRVDRLDLAPLAQLAARLPLPSGLRRGLADLSPQGEVSGLVLGWRGPPQDPQGYHVQGRAQGLSLAAGPPGPPAFGRSQTAGRPGLRGASLTVDGTEAGGQATLSIANGSVLLPGVFEQAELPLTHFKAGLTWQVKPGGNGAPQALSVTLRDADLANADLRGSLKGSWRTGPGEGFGAGMRFPGQIDLSGRIEAGATDRVARYLPLGVPEAARRYVERAVGAGRVSDGSIEVRGDLWHFPYADGSPGSFRVRVRAQDLRLAYIPSEPDWTSPWPAMTAVAGDLEFDRGAMRIANAQALLGGVALRGINGGVADLVHDPVLNLRGEGRGAAADMVRFVNASPVGNWIGDALRDTSARGPAELALALTVPIDDPGRSQVQGGVQLAGNDLRLSPGTPALAQARGRIDFTERSVRVQSGRARILGGDATIEGGTRPDGSLRFTAQGVATAEALSGAGDVAALAPLLPLGPFLRGQAGYLVQLDYAGAGPGVTVTSDLVGLGMNLPAPLNKPAAARWPLRVQTAPLAGRTGAESLRVDLNEQFRARFERDVSGAQARVTRGAIGVGEPPPPLPGSGVVARITLPRLDVDAWRALDLAHGSGASAPSDAVPTQAVLRAGELTLAGRRISGITLQLQRQAQGSDALWIGDVSAALVEGRIELRLPQDAAAPGSVTARLTRLIVPEPDGSAVSELLEQAPKSVPALDLVVDDFRWGGKALGKLELAAVNRTDPDRADGRVWQLDRLQLSAADARLTGQGRWSPGRRMVLDFSLGLTDSGRFAERMGAGSGLLGGRGTMAGHLSWAGSPLTPDTASLDGQFRIDLAEGRFLNAEPGAARLLGVLSLQALPRRLLLDFSDVFEKGFAFDSVKGDVKLSNGVASTDNLRLVGVQAAVLIEGQADLRAETQNLRVVAVPEINAGTASLAFAAINPAVGLGTFLAQLLLREPIMAASTREFTVTGRWADPKVERVERVAAEPAAPAPDGGRQ